MTSNRSGARFTLAQAFLAATLGVSALAGGLTLVFVARTEASILESSERLRDAAARHVEARVVGFLGEASDALFDVERAIRLRAVPEGSPHALEAAVFTEVQNHPRLAEIAFTRGPLPGAPAGEPPFQLSVFRASAEATSAVLTRVVLAEEGRFMASLKSRAAGGPFEAPLVPVGAAADPTAHATFTSTVAAENYGHLLWSDLHYEELDAARPLGARRVVITVQKTVDDAQGRFLGVLRVGLRTETLDTIATERVNDADPADPHRIFLCDARGRLVTRLTAADSLALSGDDLRVSPGSPSGPVGAALASPLLRRVSRDAPAASGPLEGLDRPYLVTFRALPGTQDWVVGIVVPEDYYTRDLRALRARFLLGYLVLAGLVLVAGGLAVRALRRSLGQVLRTTSGMRDFDFAAAPVRGAFRDVEEVMDGLERAKTALRALGKYVPVDLVRELYASNREPSLGSTSRNVTLMFTDIRGFTSLSEGLSPDALAQALGHYLEAMTAAIRAHGGTIDKYIGDAVMAFWNAPRPSPCHATRACEAALACLEATEALYASPAWEGRAPLFTRIGLHKDDVLVGHFGAPARLSYTALGDGVNLAARLESLCKQYGVAILVSESVEAEARANFAFRLVDRVAVKGKTQAVRVYELLALRDRVPPALAATARIYEHAFEAYCRRDFSGASALLAPLAPDGPSETLRARCDAFLQHPPPSDWAPIHTADTK